MSVVEDAPSWLLHMFSTASEEELSKICTVLWTIWVWRNKKVWDDKSIAADVAVRSSVKYVDD